MTSTRNRKRAQWAPSVPGDRGFCFMRVALGIEYDGSRFLGWQRSPARRVQDALEPALPPSPTRWCGHCAAATDAACTRERSLPFRHRSGAARLRLGARCERAAAECSPCLVASGRPKPSMPLRRALPDYRYVLQPPRAPAGVADVSGWFHAPRRPMLCARRGGVRGSTTSPLSAPPSASEIAGQIVHRRDRAARRAHRLRDPRHAFRSTVVQHSSAPVT